MQTCFFAISGVLPRDEAIAQIKKAIKKTYGKQGRRGGAEELRRRRPARWPTCTRSRCPAQVTATLQPAADRSPTRRPTSCKRVTAVMMAGKGDLLPVSAFPVDGTWPTGTTQWEKRNIAARDPGLGRRRSASSATSARWSARTPPSAPRSTTRRSSAGAPADLQVDRLQGAPRSRA